MKNIFVLAGNNSLIKVKEQELCQKLKIDDNNIVRYDLEQDFLEAIIEDARMSSLFGGRKLLIITNAMFLGATKNNIDTTILEEYLDNYNEDNYLLFEINEKVDERKKIVKKIREIGEITLLDVQNNTELMTYLLEHIKKEGYTIENKDVRLLINLVGNNILNLLKEIEKLFLYKIEDKKITEQDIKEIVSSNFEDDIFSLIEAITSKNLLKALNLYNEFINQNEEPVKIIAMLANKFRLIYQVKKYNSLGYTKDQIAKNLEVHPYPVGLALETSYNYSYQELLDLLLGLAKLDQDIKLGNCHKKNALELFLIKMC